MQTIQVNVLNPKAYKLLQDLAELELISLEETADNGFLRNTKDLVQNDSSDKKTLFKQAFGSFESEKSAEEIIEEIRSSRVSNRNTEQF